MVDQLREAELAEHVHVLLTLWRLQKSLNAELLVLLGQILKKCLFSMYEVVGHRLRAVGARLIQVTSPACNKFVTTLASQTKLEWSRGPRSLDKSKSD